MIPRYSRPEMVAIWSPERSSASGSRSRPMPATQAELGVIPKERAKTIWDKAAPPTFDIDRIDEIERETKHDVIAFLTHLAEIVGPDARFVHQGMTSSDVLDTCFNVQLVRPPTCCWKPTWTRCWPPQETRLRAQGHGHHRPQPRHPRRAGPPSA
jgi:adenylosuccinate lyase